MSIRFKRTVAGAACVAALAGGAVAVAPNASAASRGYIISAPLKAQPTNRSATVAQINWQWVDIRCWTDNGGSRWFGVNYYSSSGYVEANLVGYQPRVGHC